MKQASYQYKTNSGSLYCNVILKNDGKTSISLGTDSRRFSWRDRNNAKNLGLEIVKAEFRHEAVCSLREDNVGLVKELTEKTQQLKSEYIERCKKFAAEDFARMEKWLNKILAVQFDSKGFYSEEFYNFFGIEYEMKSILPHMPSRLHYKQSSGKIFMKAKNKISNTSEHVSLGVDHHIARAEKDALIHYEDSISKLSQRLNDKGITSDSSFKVESQTIGVNFECKITTPKISVRAWTIIASGPIQKPHYRFLVK